ncbi:hypothetical protein PMKS-003486 [Pichia membranifaciens]|uniref:Uncharacterized protein n=1 Tax=Pichia membranifaciens TaxID=4926 RepID=A0A1Q2YKB0_9ASCO|nr:hypothetical protein PMKS-003486 [Pichia membranifaciens]
MASVKSGPAPTMSAVMDPEEEDENGNDEGEEDGCVDSTDLVRAHSCEGSADGLGDTLHSGDIRPLSVGQADGGCIRGERKQQDGVG